MSLESGQYTIVSSLSKFPVGRPLVEDLSLLPKRVMTLDPGHNRETPTWEIINLDNGKYKIKTRGTYVGVMPDGHLWAFLLEDMLQGAEWRINAVPQHGENAFIILKGDDLSSGWTAQKADHQQVTVGPMIVAPSEPPMFPSQYVFNISPA